MRTHVDTRFGPHGGPASPPALLVPAVLVLLVMSVAGCGTGTGGGPTTTAGSSTTSQGGPGEVALTVEEAGRRPDGDVVTVLGYLYMSEGAFHLCSTVLESYPPQCGGAALEVVGLRPDDVVGLTTTGGQGGSPDVGWSDYQYLLRGTVRSGKLEVTPLPFVSQTARVVAVDGTEGSLRLRFSHTPVPISAGERVLWLFDLTNQGASSITVTFGSGQRGEVVLRGPDGAETYRWSHDRAFTQAVTEMTLEPGAAVGFALEEEALVARVGTYECVASVTAADSALPELRLGITIE